MGETLTRYHVSLDVADRAGVLAQVATAFAEHGVSIETVRQEKHGERRRRCSSSSPTRATDAALSATVEALRRLESCARALSVMRVEGTLSVTQQWRGVIARVRRPAARRTAHAGRQPAARAARRWCRAEHLSELTGCEVHLKVEGAQPDRLVQGPRHDGGDLQGRARRARPPSSARRPATPARRRPPTPQRPGSTCVVLVPHGRIAAGKLAQALVHDARLLQVEGGFDDCLRVARDLADELAGLAGQAPRHRDRARRTSTSFEGSLEVGDGLTATRRRTATVETPPRSTRNDVAAATRTCARPTSSTPSAFPELSFRVERGAARSARSTFRGRGRPDACTA